jgi:polysaccharide biosynthesis/export protein
MHPSVSLGRGSRFAFSFLSAFLCIAPMACAQSQSQAPEISLGDTPQQANQRIKELSMGMSSKNTTSHDYVIGNGDLLDISVFDVPELTREIRVSQLGTIGMPLIPVRLRVAGLTELQTEQKIAEVLEANGLVSHADVGVVVKEHRSRPITIVGAVMHPMVYEADRSVTLLEALAESGGISNDAGDTVIVTRLQSSAFTEVPATAASENQAAPGSTESVANAPSPKASSADSTVFPSPSQMAQTAPAATDNIGLAGPGPSSSNTITINLNDLIETGDTRNNITLQAGDVVTVPHAGIVYVLGAVTRPGGFVLSNDRATLTTLKVLTLAGGLTNIAKLQHAVIIRRNDQGKQTETEVDLKSVLQRQSEDIQMRPSDILYIPDDKKKQALIKTAEIALAVGSAIAIFRLAYPH